MTNLLFFCPRYWIKDENVKLYFQGTIYVEYVCIWQTCAELFSKNTLSHKHQQCRT